MSLVTGLRSKTRSGPIMHGTCTIAPERMHAREREQLQQSNCAPSRPPDRPHARLADAPPSAARVTPKSHGHALTRQTTRTQHTRPPGRNVTVTVLHSTSLHPQHGRKRRGASDAPITSQGTADPETASEQNERARGGCSGCTPGRGANALSGRGGMSTPSLLRSSPTASPTNKSQAGRPG